MNRSVVADLIKGLLLEVGHDDFDWKIVLVTGPVRVLVLMLILVHRWAEWLDWRRKLRLSAALDNMMES